MRDSYVSRVTSYVSPGSWSSEIIARGIAASSSVQSRKDEYLRYFSSAGTITARALMSVSCGGDRNAGWKRWYTVPDFHRPGICIRDSRRGGAANRGEIARSSRAALCNGERLCASNGARWTLLARTLSLCLSPADISGPCDPPPY